MEKKDWYRLGFLEGLDNEVASTLSDGYDILYNILLDDNEKNNNYGEVEIITFSVLRRCHKNNLDMDLTEKRILDILNKLVEYLTPERIELATKNSYNAIDGEAELIFDFCENYG